MSIFNVGYSLNSRKSIHISIAWEEKRERESFDDISKHHIFQAGQFYDIQPKQFAVKSFYHDAIFFRFLSKFTCNVV